MLQFEQRSRRAPKCAFQLGEAQIARMLGRGFSDSLSIAGQYSACPFKAPYWL